MVKCIPNLGMPNQRHPELYGLLIVKFEVEFPENNFLSDVADYSVCLFLLLVLPVFFHCGVLII